MPDAVNAPPHIHSDRFFDSRPQSFNGYVLGLIFLGIASVYHLGPGWLASLSFMAMLPFLLCITPFLVVTALHFFQRWFERRRENVFLTQLRDRPAQDSLKTGLFRILTSGQRRRNAWLLSDQGQHFWSVSDAMRLSAILSATNDLSDDQMAGYIDAYQAHLATSFRAFRRAKPMLESLIMFLGCLLGSYMLRHGVVLLGGMLNGLMIGVSIGVLGAYALMRAYDAWHCYRQDKNFASTLGDIAIQSQSAGRDASLGSVGSVPDPVPPKYKEEWDGPPEGEPPAATSTDPSEGGLPPYPIPDDDVLPGYSGPPTN